jgi:hypothetical protein
MAEARGVGWGAAPAHKWERGNCRAALKRHLR